MSIDGSSPEYSKEEIHEVLVSILEALQAIDRSINLIIDMAADDKEVGEA